MPYFIVHHLPTGLRGIFLAGIFASAMSTMSSSINSLASSTCIDLLELNKNENMPENRLLTISRAVSIAWACVLFLAAIAFSHSTKSLVEVALSIASITYGGVLGVFLMERFLGHFESRSVLAGMMGGISASATLALFTVVSWLYYIAAGCFASIMVAALCDGGLRLLFSRSRPR
jgi:Na+/proline symporter